MEWGWVVVVLCIYYSLYISQWLNLDLMVDMALLGGSVFIFMDLIAALKQHCGR
jgi:hypothetical protein